MKIDLLILIGKNNYPRTERATKSIYKNVKILSDKISVKEAMKTDKILSIGYRHIIKKDILDIVGRRQCLNAHPSYLPFNRGAHPNLWSWVNDTPKGFTVHHIDEGIDTGDIVYQEEMSRHLNKQMTFRESYEIISNAMDLFVSQQLPFLFNLNGRMQSVTREPTHKVKDIEKFYFQNGWDTKIKDFLEQNENVI